MNDMRQRLLEMERKNLIGKLITLIQLHERWISNETECKFF